MHEHNYKLLKNPRVPTPNTKGQREQLVFFLTFALP